ncbi:hypothetical protein Val02_69360 [Virgisporangium aliadipatigenens]|uniref:GPP34 family phosphoprotein n=1 Tax=Virgisporangium aliadipatigenens TaxID=741659 RepID=A0A8J4DTA4_9ACTN|nr:GPP34 family phosphoprotein [Virgisporangium aliadipatigenens]GIJ50050.1 hypothetical protein Val02_69360 [Virgisporangium aliadipatigenens]
MHTGRSWPRTEPADQASPVLLAGDLFLVAHQKTRRCEIHSRVLASGLAGSLLAELVLFGNISAKNGVLKVERREPPRDALAHSVLDTMLSQPQHQDLSTWVRFWETSAVDEVAKRLQRRGLVRKAPRWGVRRSRSGWETVGREDVVAAPGLRLAYRLMPYSHGGADPLSSADVMLASLVDLLGLTETVLWDRMTRPAALAELGRVRACLTPNLTEVLEAVSQVKTGQVLAPH